jgi:predicted MFS family arabinose efflux permease
MTGLVRNLIRGFQISGPSHRQGRDGYIHLYLEMVGMGILNGSTLAFVSIFASRLGATGSQIGLITAAPGIISLFFTFPAGEWLARQPIGRAVFWSTIGQRLFYLLLVFLPVMFDPAVRVEVLILYLFLMNIPGTAVAVGMNALFGAIVEPEQRGHVMGVRNAYFSAAQTLTALVCSQLLASLPFAGAYQMVFALGFVGAALSSLQVWLMQSMVQPQPRTESGEAGWKPEGRVASISILTRLAQPLRLEVMRGPFGRVIFLLFCFHFVQFLPLPIFPIYTVRVLRLSDQTIAIGTMLFTLGTFLGSTQLARITRRMGSQRATALGIIVLAFYPVLLIYGENPLIYFANAAVGGTFFALIFGALYNYLLEKSRAADLPAHMAWYNLALNAAILLGSLSGPVAGDLLGLPGALVLAGFCRLLVGLIIYFKG